MKAREKMLTIDKKYTNDDLDRGAICPAVLGYKDHCKGGDGDCKECWDQEVETNPIKPEYYNDSKITPFDVIDDWNLDFYLGNAVKYIKRAGKKKDNSRLQDLKKIREYIEQEIRLERSKSE